MFYQILNGVAQCRGFSRHQNVSLQTEALKASCEVQEVQDVSRTPELWGLPSAQIELHVQKQGQSCRDNQRVLLDLLLRPEGLGMDLDLANQGDGDRGKRTTIPGRYRRTSGMMLRFPPARERL